jgi:hypothetical protein
MNTNHPNHYKKKKNTNPNHIHYNNNKTIYKKQQRKKLTINKLTKQQNIHKNINILNHPIRNNNLLITILYNHIQQNIPTPHKHNPMKPTKHKNKLPTITNKHTNPTNIKNNNHTIQLNKKQKHNKKTKKNTLNNPNTQNILYFNSIIRNNKHIKIPHQLKHMIINSSNPLIPHTSCNNRNIYIHNIQHKKNKHQHPQK